MPLQIAKQQQISFFRFQLSSTFMQDPKKSIAAIPKMLQYPTNGIQYWNFTSLKINQHGRLFNTMFLKKAVIATHLREYGKP